MSKAQRRRQSQAQTRDSPEPEDLERQQREEESEAIALEEEQTARRNLHRLGFTLPFKESQHVNLMDAYAVQVRIAEAKCRNLLDSFLRGEDTTTFADKIKDLRLEVEVWSAYLQAIQLYDSSSELQRTWIILSYMWSFRPENPPWFPVGTFTVVGSQPNPDPNRDIPKAGQGRARKNILRGSLMCLLIALNHPTMKPVFKGRPELLARFCQKQDRRGLNRKVLEHWRVGKYDDPGLRGPLKKPFKLRNWPEKIEDWIPATTQQMADWLQNMTEDWKKSNWQNLFRPMYSSREIAELGPLPLGDVKENPRKRHAAEMI